MPFKGHQYARKSLLELKHNIMQQKWIEAIKGIEYYRNAFSHILSRKDMNNENPNDEILAERFLQFLSDKLHASAGSYISGAIDDLVMKDSLKQQIIKNPSNVALLYQEANDEYSLRRFKEQLKFDPDAMKDFNSFINKASESQKSLSRIDRKTLSVIEKLKT